MTTVSVRRLVRSPFSAAIEFAERVIARREGWYVTPAAPFAEHVRVVAESTSDPTDDVRKHDALIVAWRPQTRFLFPDFRGWLTVRPKGRWASIRFEGRYDPPFGLIGRIFDFVAGRRIARRTMRRFLNDLASEIESEYQQERRRSATIGENDVQVHSVPR